MRKMKKKCDTIWWSDRSIICIGIVCALRALLRTPHTRPFQHCCIGVLLFCFFYFFVFLSFFMVKVVFPFLVIARIVVLIDRNFSICNSNLFTSLPLISQRYSLFSFFFPYHSFDECFCFEKFIIFSIFLCFMR